MAGASFGLFDLRLGCRAEDAALLVRGSFQPRTSTLGEQQDLLMVVNYLLSSPFHGGQSRGNRGLYVGIP